MPDDELVLLLSRLETDVPPIRPAVAESLRTRLLAELGSGEGAPVPRPVPGVTTSSVPQARPAQPSRRWLPMPPLPRPSLRPLTLRGLLAAAALVLLLVAVAAATGLVIREWLSSGPAGPQYTDDFTLTEVYREPGAFYLDLHMAPDGRSLLAMRVPVAWPDREPSAGAIVRFEPASDGSWRPRDVLPFEWLRDPALWDPGTVLTDVAIGRTPNMPDSVSVAEDGTVFVAASLFEPDLARPRGASTIVAMDPDGTLQPVLTSGQLLESGLFDRLDAVIGMSVVAAAPDVLWGRVDGPVVDPPGNHTWLFTLTDPDSDGDWTDRVIRPVRLPSAVPQVEYGNFGRFYGSFVAEPSRGDRDGPWSVLLPVLEHDGAIRLFRLRDAQADGDLTAPGEAELVYEGLTSSEAAGLGIAPPISPRVVDLPGGRRIDEIVAGGLSRASRVSRISPDGVVDVVRALPHWADDVEADREGRIYVVTQEAGEVHEDGTFEPPTLLIYRLDPVPVGGGPDPAPATPPATEAGSATPPASQPNSPSPGPSSPPGPLPAPPWEPAPLSAGVPRVAFAVYGPTSSGQQEALVVGLDGSGPRRVVAEGQVWSFCQSADGSQVISRSVLDVPGEPFVRLAAADGSGQITVSETANTYWCGSPPGAALLGTGPEALSPQTVIRHDLVTGAESVIASGVVVLGVSPDGTQLAIVDETERSWLEVVDVATAERRRIAGPDDQTIRAAWWAPDGGSVAYLSGQTTGFDPSAEEDLVLRVVDLAGGPPRTLLAFHGREPGVSWSADARQMLLRAPTSHSDAFVPETPEGPLWLIDVASGEARTVLHDGVRWADWSPVDPATFAYATADALYLETPGGEATRLLDRPLDPLCDVCWAEGPWQVGHWLGWSPDGGFIGLGKYSGAIAAVDVESGALVVPLVSDEQRWIDEPRWWR